MKTHRTDRKGKDAPMTSLWASETYKDSLPSKNEVSDWTKARGLHTVKIESLDNEVEGTSCDATMSKSRLLILMFQKERQHEVSTTN